MKITHAAAKATVIASVLLYTLLFLIPFEGRSETKIKLEEILITSFSTATGGNKNLPAIKTGSGIYKIDNAPAGTFQIALKNSNAEQLECTLVITPVDGKAYTKVFKGSASMFAKGVSCELPKSASITLNFARIEIHY